eukprot:1189376-Prorocentrum_minimum.AAC.5
MDSIRSGGLDPPASYGAKNSSSDASSASSAGAAAAARLRFDPALWIRCSSLVGPPVPATAAALLSALACRSSVRAAGRYDVSCGRRASGWLCQAPVRRRGSEARRERQKRWEPR